MLCFNYTATTEIYTLSLHDALPISAGDRRKRQGVGSVVQGARQVDGAGGPREQSLRRTRHKIAPQRRGAEAAAQVQGDRKSTRLNSSHSQISYAVFCLKKKKKQQHT